MSHAATVHSDELPLPEASIRDLVVTSADEAFLRAQHARLTSGGAEKLASIQRSFKTDTLSAALRLLDSAWRSVPPEDLPIFAPLYAYLLALESADHSATLGMLQRAHDAGPDVDLVALHALTLARLNRPEEASSALQEALSLYCVQQGGLLAEVAAAIIRHPAVAAPGWVGRGARLELVGQLVPSGSTVVLQITMDDSPPVTQLLRSADRDGQGPFDFRLPQFSECNRVGVSSGGELLLGSGLRLPSDYDVDGCVEAKGRLLEGWTRMGWHPKARPRVRIENEHGHHLTLRSAEQPFGAYQWPLKLDLRSGHLHGDRLTVKVQLPNGCWKALPDSPLLLPPAIRRRGSNHPPLQKWKPSKSKPNDKPVSESNRAEWTDVIIPVFRGREESLACINSVLATVDANRVRVVVIDDATDDEGLAQALDSLAANGCITLLRNAQNSGFVRSVNHGLALHPTRDAVILNSDTIVYSDWLLRLREAAYSEPRVGTVTPLSNNGSIASYPSLTGSRVDPQSGKLLDELAKRTHGALRLDIPVGVGFCLYMRRDCLREVGELDADIFGHGYGEETDFCLRASRQGWLHRLAADVFVYHAGGSSFGKRRERLLQRSQRLLNLLHANYDRYIASFLAQDPIGLIRRRLDEERLKSLSARFVLLVTASLSGGVDRFVRERSRDLQDRGLTVLLLRPAAPNDRDRCELWSEQLELPNLRYRIPADLELLRSLLRSLRFEAVEIQHFLHLDSKVIETVRGLSQAYDVFIHDYAWICPRVTLIDSSGRYCGEPSVIECARCVKRNGTLLGEPITVPKLRRRSERWLSQAKRVVVPSADTAKRLGRYFTSSNVVVRSHGAPGERCAPPVRSKDNVVRVALLGAIGRHKGYQVLLDCAKDARRKGLPIEFVVIGYTEDDARLSNQSNIFITGRYSDGEVTHLIAREAPDILWLPSVWPETWSYTLDHALNSGLPIVTFDLGAIAERLTDVDGAVRLPLTATPALINQVFIDMSHTSDDVKMKDSHSGERKLNNTPPRNQEESTADGLSAFVQVLPLPPGLYLFSVQAATPVATASTGQLSLPAVHVGLGPGVPADEVEFVEGLSTHGGWLFAQGDLLVSKVKSNGATLVLTSMRAPGGEALSIKVEKLEARIEAAGERNAAAQQSRTSNGAAATKQSASRTAANDDDSIPLAIGAHIRTRGDMSFSEVPWAGRIAPGLWVESFSVRPLERFGSQDIEYKALTASGFETPWLSDDKMCGTKGMSTPLLGFAVRMKPSPAAAAYDCEYTGYFASGLTVGPVRNGVPCRSSIASDPLEGMQVRLIKRSATMLPRVVARGSNGNKSGVDKKRTKRNGNGQRSVRAARRASSRGS